jgi:hypothetical protein
MMAAAQEVRQTKSDFILRCKNVRSEKYICDDSRRRGLENNCLGGFDRHDLQNLLGRSQVGAAGEKFMLTGCI